MKRGQTSRSCRLCFDRLSAALCRLLVYRDWWLTGATVSRYHPQLISDRDLVSPVTQ